MRKVCIAVLVLALVAAGVLAQSESLTESMTEAQLEEYNRNRLVVDVGIGISSGFGGVNAYTKWTGRKGFQQLSESEFYATAGYPEYAEQAARYRNVGWGLLIGGGIVSVGGLAWMTLGVTALDYDDPDYLSKMNTSLYGGMALSLGGLIPFWIGSSRVRKNWSSAEQAQMVADEYNRKLAKRIRGQEASLRDQTTSYRWQGLPILLPTSFAPPSSLTR